MSSVALSLPEHAAQDWYDVPTIISLGLMSRRTLFAKLASVPENAKRLQRADVGRPHLLIHKTALPQLHAWHVIHTPSPAASPLPPAKENRGEGSITPPSAARASKASPAPDAASLAIAELRMLAVKEYESLCKAYSKDLAARLLSEEWTRRPHTKSVQIRERVGNDIKKSQKSVCVGNFKPKTLRAWYSLYKKAKSGGKSDAEAMLALAPAFTSRGRTAIDIPEDSLEFVRTLAISTARADVANAVAQALPHLPETLRSISLKTWQRRISAADPHKRGKALMQSVSAFRSTMPDVSVDWDQIPYNHLWEIDDVEKDWYGYSTDLQRLIRPHGYAIIRVRTRKWLAFAASETDITHEQIKALLGFAFAQPGAGIPEKIKFEHKTAAANQQFKTLLTSLGIVVSETSLDTGRVLAGFAPDPARGHPQGHAVVEANHRRTHGLEAFQPGQVGGEERHTAPARMETLKALAASEAKQGRLLPFPTPQQWYLTFYETMEKHNNTPHSGLPMVVDPATGKPRHMSPNECEASLAEKPIRVMDEKLIPLFHATAAIVPVTKNGFILNTHNYGRFDEALQQFAEVHVFASTDYPAVAYVQELGRCVQTYVKETPGAFSQFEKKRSMESKFRNAHEGMVARAIESGKNGVFDMLLASADVTPNRVRETVAPAALVADAEALAAGIAQHRARQSAQDARFSLARETGEGAPPCGAGEGNPSQPSRPGGLLSRSQDLADQVNFLTDGGAEQ